MSNLKKFQTSFHKFSVLYLGETKKSLLPYESFIPGNKSFRIVVDGVKALQAGIEENPIKSMENLGHRVSRALPNKSEVHFDECSRLVLDLPYDGDLEPLIQVFSKIAKEIVDSRKKHPKEQKRRAENKITNTINAERKRLERIFGQEKAEDMLCDAMKSVHKKVGCPQRKFEYP